MATQILKYLPAFLTDPDQTRQPPGTSTLHIHTQSPWQQGWAWCYKRPSEGDNIGTSCFIPVGLTIALWQALDAECWKREVIETDSKGSAIACGYLSNQLLSYVK